MKKKKKEPYLFASLRYHEIINFYQVVIIIHDAHINMSKYERFDKFDYINYRRNWYFIYEKTKFMELRYSFDFFRSLDRDNLYYKEYDHLIKPKLAAILKHWWLSENKTKARWNIFLSRIFAYCKRIFRFHNFK